jgi:DNA-directed RNA polymerase specialized sigma24 family protein
MFGMSDLIELVRAYRKAPNLADRLRLADEIIRIIGPQLGWFVFGRVPEAAKDVTQEVLNSIAGSLETFKGNSNGEFWNWCYRIAQRRISDYPRQLV